MATLNERINELLSRLEAAAAGDTPGSRPQNVYYPGPNAQSMANAQQLAGQLYAQALAKSQGQQMARPSFAGPVDQPVQPESAARESGQAEQTASRSAARAVRPVAPALTSDSLMQGVVFAEILGRPVSRRRGRGRHGF